MIGHFNEGKPSITVLAPVFNEEKSLTEFVFQILNLELTELVNSVDILLVDDGSSDNSWQIIKQIVDETEDVGAIRLSRNFGKEAAIYAGLGLIETDLVVVMDSDLQHPPILIPSMIEAWKKGNAIVNARKIVRQKESWINRKIANAYYVLMKSATGMDLSNASDFKLLDRNAVAAVLEFNESHTFFRAVNHWIGFETVNVDFEPDERFSGKSNWSFSSKVRLAIVGLTSFSSLPIKAIGFVGALMAVLSVYVSIEVLLNILSGSAAQGFATVIFLQILTSTFIMISQMILAVYVYRVYGEVKSRPRYLISARLQHQREKP